MKISNHLTYRVSFFRLTASIEIIKFFLTNLQKHEITTIGMKMANKFI